MTFDRAYYEDVVKHPGKFEGEEPWVPYFYDQMMNGCADESGEDWDWLEISDDDKKIWPELEGETHILLTYSDTGFVYGALGVEIPVDHDLGGEGG